MTNNSPNLLQTTPRQELHVATSWGRWLLDKIHFTGWTYVEADEYDRLYVLQRELAIPVLPRDPKEAEDIPRYEKARIMHAALGTENLEETQRVVNAAGRTLDTVINRDIDAVDPRAFYAAQDVVKMVWEGTMPLEFRD